MTDAIYREIILEHYKNPQNYGRVKNADFDVSDLNPLCGDEIRVTARFKDNKLSKIAFTSQGCAISKASASLFTETIKGKTKKEIQNIKPEEVIALLEVDLSPVRTKCALLVYSVVQKGLADRSSSRSLVGHTK